MEFSDGSSAVCDFVVIGVISGSTLFVLFSDGSSAVCAFVVIGVILISFPKMSLIKNEFFGVLISDG